MTRFQDLHADATLAVIALLHPKDILSLGATCRALNDLTNQRVVWINAALPSSSDLDSLDAAALRDRVLRPFRFQSNVRKLQPTNIRLLGTRALPKEPGVYSRQYNLLPGGRWLLSADNAGFVKLWDLQEGEGEMVSAVAEFKVPGEVNCEMRVQPCSDDGGVVALVSCVAYSAAGDRDESVHVLHVNPGLGRPSISERASFPKFGRHAFATLSGDFVVNVTVKGSILVWNWVKDECAELLEAGDGLFPERRVRISADGTLLTTYNVLGGTPRTFAVPPEALLPRGQGLSSSAPVTLAPSLPDPSALEFKFLGLLPTMHTPSPTSTILASLRTLLLFLPSRLPPIEIPWKRSNTSPAYKAATGTTVDGDVVVMINNACATGLEVHWVRSDGLVVKSALNVVLPGASGGLGVAAWKVLFCSTSGVVCLIHPSDGKVWLFDFAV